MTRKAGFDYIGNKKTERRPDGGVHDFSRL